MTTIYGIKNCDTMKKAQKWLDGNGINFEFHDYRKQGINSDMVLKFADALGWDSIINKRGTTFRNLSDEQKAILVNATEQAEAAALLLTENEAVIKRPILVHEDNYYVGFKDADYQGYFAS